MVEVELPDLTEEFVALVPEQRALINRLMSAGTIASYALSLDRARLWVTVVSPSEREAREIIDTFPIAPYIEYSLTELMFLEHPQLNVTHFSLN